MTKTDISDEIVTIFVVRPRSGLYRFSAKRAQSTTFAEDGGRNSTVGVSQPSAAREQPTVAASTYAAAWSGNPDIHGAAVGGGVMVAEAKIKGRLIFPEIRIAFRPSHEIALPARLQAALLSTVFAAAAVFAYLGASRHSVEHLAAKREAAVERLRAANSELRDHADGLARQLAAVVKDRDQARTKAAMSVGEAGHLRGQLELAQAQLQKQDQMQQALQQQRAQNARLNAQLGKIETDRAAEEAQLARDKASLEETAKELAQMVPPRGVKRGRVHLELGEVWRRLSEIALPLAGGEPQPAAAQAVAAAARQPANPAPGDLDPQSAAALEQGLRAAGVDVKRVLSQLGSSHAEGGPFVPPPRTDNAAGETPSPEKLAAIAALARTLPLAAPLIHYELGSRFGPRIDPFNHRLAFHTGLDMDAPYSSPVYATAPGIVIYAGWLGDYGQVVEIDHGFGIVTLYAHLRRLLVAVGQSVAAQAEIGLVGTTGRSTGPHVHYEVRVNGQPQDPEKFLNLERLLPAAVNRPVIPVAGGPEENSH
jgi:murein DD-endopeptidase MepM/ murein hydrolase activator NlpD